MLHHIKDYYKQSSDNTPHGKFNQVISVTASTNWKDVHEKVPSLPRGWFELAQLKTNDRIEFTRDFWISKLPYHPHLQEFLIHFFQSIEDIYIFLVQQKFDDPFAAHLVYGLKHDTGFCKTTDCTGVLKSEIMKSTQEKFLSDFLKLEKDITYSKGTSINGNSLIPFYESFGMPFYQCFYKDWYPEDEMGNIYYSGDTHTISDVKNKDPESESMAFRTFSDWLMFYLETIS